MLLNCGAEGLLRVSWTAKRSNQSILKEINPEYSLEGLMLKLKLQYFGHLMQRANSLEKTDTGKDWGQEEKGTTENEMVGWHHRLNGHESEQTPGDSEGQGSLVCCSPWGCRARHHLATEQQQWPNKKPKSILTLFSSSIWILHHTIHSINNNLSRAYCVLQIQIRIRHSFYLQSYFLYNKYQYIFFLPLARKRINTK